MKIHEFQAKRLFEDYGIPTARGAVAETPEQAAKAASELGGFVAVKAQVLVGGRGKAGGIKLARSPEEAEARAGEILSMTIKGLPVERVLVSEAVDIAREYYLGFILDRTSRRIVFMLTGEGGVEIEELADSRPEAIVRFPIDPGEGIDETALTEVLRGVFDRPELVDQDRRTALALYRLFLDKDCSLVEINPYTMVKDGRLLALDAKINFDDNALDKHPEIQELRNPEEYSPDEIEAREKGLSFVSMDGDIGCIVNGAGLAMTTMDLIKHFGSEPANFLDVGGSSDPAKVLVAMEIVTGDPDVKAILLNIFGGITRCDDIAAGLLAALKKMPLTIPLVVRLTGTNEDEGRAMLAEAGITAGVNLDEAVQKAVAAAREGR